MGVTAFQITSFTIVYSVTGEFLAQMASNAENVFIWWRHHDQFEWGSQVHRANISQCFSCWQPCGIFHHTSLMMTSSKGNIFRVTGPLCREFTDPRWILRTKASNAELWCFRWSAPSVNGWENNREAGDLRRHHAHYDVNVMRNYMNVNRWLSWK